MERRQQGVESKWRLPGFAVTAAANPEERAPFGSMLLRLPAHHDPSRVPR